MATVNDILQSLGSGVTGGEAKKKSNPVDTVKVVKGTVYAGGAVAATAAGYFGIKWFQSVGWPKIQDWWSGVKDKLKDPFNTKKTKNDLAQGVKNAQKKVDEARDKVRQDVGRAAATTTSSIVKATQNAKSYWKTTGSQATNQAARDVVKYGRTAASKAKESEAAKIIAKAGKSAASKISKGLGKLF